MLWIDKWLLIWPIETYLLFLVKALLSWASLSVRRRLGAQLSPFTQPFTTKAERRTIWQKGQKGGNIFSRLFALALLSYCGHWYVAVSRLKEKTWVSFVVQSCTRPPIETPREDVFVRPIWCQFGVQKYGNCSGDVFVMSSGKILGGQTEK